MTNRRKKSHRTCFLVSIFLCWICSAGVNFAQADSAGGKFLANPARSAAISGVPANHPGKNPVAESSKNKKTDRKPVKTLSLAGTVPGTTSKQGSNVKDIAYNAGTTSGNTGGTGDIENRPVGKRGLTTNLPGTGKNSGKKGSGGKVLPKGPSLWQVLLALSGVLVLIVGISYIFCRYLTGMRQKSSGGVIEILAYSSINPRQSLCLVRVGEKLLLLGISPGHIARLDVLDDPDEIAMIAGRLEQKSAQSITSTFSRLFHRESLNYDSQDDSLFNDISDDIASNDVDMEGLNGREHLLQDGEGELKTLLNKVKALTRMGFRAGK